MAVKSTITNYRKVPPQTHVACYDRMITYSTVALRRLASLSFKYLDVSSMEAIYTLLLRTSLLALLFIHAI
jgi:hypothetical protein